MKVATVGLDIAKRVFQVHGVDDQGAVVLRRSLQRDEVAPFFANLPWGWKRAEAHTTGRES